MEYIVFSAAHETFSKIHPTLGHAIILSVIKPKEKVSISEEKTKRSFWPHIR